MISDLIITAFLGGLNALLSLMPDYELPISPTLIADGRSLWSNAVSLNSVVPLGTITKVIFAALTLRLLLILWDLIVFVYHQFWGSN